MSDHLAIYLGLTGPRYLIYLPLEPETSRLLLPIPSCLLSLSEVSILPNIPMVREQSLLLAPDLEMPKDHSRCFPPLCRLFVPNGLPLFINLLICSL
jgi:hypothetical protein